MFKKNGKKAGAYVALLLTLIMCLGTLLEGAIAFADVDTQVANNTSEASETIKDDTTDADVPSADDSKNTASEPSKEDESTGAVEAAKVIQTEDFDMKVSAVSKSLYLNISGEKQVWVSAVLDAKAGYTFSAFDVYDKTANKVIAKNVAKDKSTTITVEDEHQYCVQAAATDTEGKEVILESMEMYTVNFPEKVTDLKATCAKKDNLIKVTWDKVDGANRYYVYRNTKATRPSKPIKTVTGNSFSERRKGGSYYYWVQAANTTDAAASDFVKSGKVTAGNYLAIPVRNYWFTATAKKRIPIYKSAKSKKVIGYLPKGKTVVIKKKSPKVVPQYGVVKRVYFDDKNLKKKGWVSFRSVKLKNHVAGKSNDWSRSVKENYVNKKKFKSSTNYLIWLSKYTQKVYVFKRANKHSKWVLKKTYRCSSGTFAHPTPTNMNYILVRKQYDRHRVTNKGMRYYYKYLSAFGKKGSSGRGNAFHTVCWREGTHKMLKPVKDKPNTKGCARMFTGEAKWIYKHVPTKTRVVSY